MAEWYLSSRCHYCPLSLALFVRNSIRSTEIRIDTKNFRGSHVSFVDNSKDFCRAEKQYSTTFRLLYQARLLPNRALRREKDRLSKEVQHLKWRYDRCATKAELWPDARDTCVRHRVSEDDSRWNDGPFPVYSRTAYWIVPGCKRLIPHSFGFSYAWNRGHSWKKSE